MKKSIISLTLCTALFVSAAHAITSLSLKELRTQIQQNPDKKVIIIDFDQFFVTPNKQEFEQEFQAMREQVITAMEQEKDQKKLAEAFEHIGLAFAQKMVGYLKPSSPEHVDIIKQLQETNAKIIFITDFQPPVVDLIIERLTKYGIDISRNAINQEPTILRSKKGDDESAFGIYTNGIIFVADCANYKAAAEHLIQETNFQPDALYFLEN